MTNATAATGSFRGTRGALSLALLVASARVPDGLARRGVDLAARIAPAESGEVHDGATVSTFSTPTDVVVPRQRTTSAGAVPTASAERLPAG